MSFEALNERGEIKGVEKDPLLFHFEYMCGFYGSCTFLAKVIEGKPRPLSLDEHSISLEAYTLKGGNQPVLLNAAKIFFKSKLNKYTQLSQLRK